MRKNYFFNRALQKSRSAGSSLRMHTFLKILTITLLMLEAAGCGCTDLGCNDALDITFNKTSTVWEPGKYVVYVEADGVKNSCAMEMPFMGSLDCTSRGQMTIDLLPLSGPSNETKGPRGVMVFGTPAVVKVTVERDGVELGTKSVMPKYTEVSPNGEMCGPTCGVSAADLSVP